MSRVSRVKLFSFRNLFWLFSTSAVLLLILYLYFMGLVVLRGSLRQDLVDRATQISGELLELEGQYLALAGKINTALALEQGFITVQKIHYLNFPDQKSRLSFGSNGSQ